MQCSIWFDVNWLPKEKTSIHNCWSMLQFFQNFEFFVYHFFGAMFQLNRFHVSSSSIE